MSFDPQDPSSHSLEVFACPSDYTPSRFFARYNKSFVAPIYHKNLADIGRFTNTDVLKLWGWTFDQLAERISIRRDAQEFGSYVADRRDGTVPCAASTVSEVFKSAYLRVLEALSSANMIDEASLRALSAIVCPVDLSFWEIGAEEQPSWWPRVSQSKENFQSSEEWEKTSELPLTTLDGSDLIFAKGPLTSEKDDLQSVSFSLIPFGYKVAGKHLPPAGQIFNLLKRPVWSLDSMHPKALSIFDAPLPEWTSDNQEGIRIGDLLMLPLLARIDTANINCWQYWRGMNPLVFPAAHLAKGGAAAVSARAWSLKDEGRTVFSGFNWTNGPMRRLRFQFGECGQFATCDRAWLESFLGKKNLNLGFVLNHNYRIRKSEYSEYESSSFAKLLRVNQIISPDFA
jgi:hypothetical protein